MGNKRQRAPHFIAGLGDGHVQPQLTNEEGLFPASQRLTPYVRSRRTNNKAALIYKDAFSASGDGIPTAASTGPWQISAMALLCIMGLLVGLFLHLVTADKHAYPPRRVRARSHASPTKKKKTDEWSDDERVDDDSYGADSEALYYPYHAARYGNPQQQHRHRRTGSSSNSGTLHHRMPAVTTYKGPSSSRHAGSTTSPGPTLRTTRSIDSATGLSSRGATTRPSMDGVQQAASTDEDVGGVMSPWRATSLNARPLSPISSFASIENHSNNMDTSIDTQHEGDEETGTPPRPGLYSRLSHAAASFDALQSSSSRLLSAGTEDDLETPRAGTRARKVLLEQSHRVVPQFTPSFPPPMYEPLKAAAASDKNPIPFIPDLAIHESWSEPTTEQRPRALSIEERHLVDMNLPPPWQGGETSHAAAYPGHAHPRASPPAEETPPASNDPRKNIIHKRQDITHCTDAESSLMSSVEFSEITLESVIGGGGFGQVWKATWRSTPVAVKILTGSAQREIVSKAILEEFAAEINMLKGMRHPNICLYMGACFKPPNRAIITELAANGSLWDALRLPLSALYTVSDGKSRDAWPLSLYSDRHSTPNPPIAPKGTWPWDLVKRVACGAARGMTYLHSGNPPVLHRDMKSANLLLDESYTAKVCDFGLSRLKAQERSMTGNCGTVQWMAPEVLANQRYAEPADVYSFGIIVWEMLTGECPYDGMSAIQCALAVLNRDLRPEIPSFCPPKLVALIKLCLEKDPSRRPTFAQILLALDAMP